MENEFLRKRPEAKSRKIIFDILNWFLPIATVTIGLFFGTEQFAKSMNYDTVVVGHPLTTLFGYKIYNPLLILFAYVKFITQPAYIPYFNTAFQPVFFSIFVSFLLLIMFAFFTGIKKKDSSLYGTARWGNDKDLIKFGLLQKAGVVLGQKQQAKVTAHVDIKNQAITLAHVSESNLLCHGGKTNTLVLAPTRSGKGVSIVIPTLIKWLGSIVCFDPKGENYSFTAKFRSRFSHVIKFAPLSRDTIRFNPVTEIRDGDYAYRDANTIADIIFAPANSKGEQGGTEEFFTNSAKDLFTTALLHVRFSDIKDKSIAGVLKLLSQSANEEAVQYNESEEETDYTEVIFEQIKNATHSNKVIHEKIISGASRAIQMNPKVRSDTLSTIYAKIQLFEDPLLANATSGNDFELNDFINSEKPISLYLVVPFSDVDRIAPVFRLLITFILRKFSDGETGYGSITLKNHLLFLLDEFPILGCFPFLVKTMGVLAGYGITFLIICQGINQIIDLYGQNHPFLDHCKTVALFAPGKYEDAKMFCEIIGKESVVRENISTSGSRFQVSLNNINLSDQEVARDLMNPDELLKLPPNEVLILNHGMPPYIGKKVVYYQDPRFKCFANIAGNPMEPAKKRADLIKEVAGLPSNLKRREEMKKQRGLQESILEHSLEEEQIFQTSMFESDLPIQKEIDVKQEKVINEQSY